MFLLSVLFRSPVVFVRAIFLDFRVGHPVWANGNYMKENLEVAKAAALDLVRIENVHGKWLLRGWYAAASNIARLELYRRRKRS